MIIMTNLRAMYYGTQIGHDDKSARYLGIEQQKRQFELITQTAFGLVALSCLIHNPKAMTGSFTQSNTIGQV